MWAKLITVAIIGVAQTIGVVRRRNYEKRKVKLIIQLCTAVSKWGDTRPDIIGTPCFCDEIISICDSTLGEASRNSLLVLLPVYYYLDRTSEKNKYFAFVTLHNSLLHASLRDDALYHHCNNNANCITINCATNNEHPHETITPQHIADALH